MDFAHKFALGVKHHSIDGYVGDWQPFFGCDSSAVIASIQHTNPTSLRNDVRSILAQKPTLVALEPLYALLTDLAEMLDRWLTGVGKTTEFQLQIRKRIRANLTQVIVKFLGYHKAVAEHLALPSVVPPKVDNIAEAIGLTPSTVAADISQLGDSGLFGDSGDPEQEARSAFDRTQPIFSTLYNVLLDVIRIAPNYFTKDLEGREDHEPHFALFVAFLRLYLQVQEHANGLTEDHLDFFYQDILGIEKRAADPDQVHVLVELARQVEREHLLPQDNDLDAGKDATGVALRYALDTDLVANKARVSSLKTVFLTPQKDLAQPTILSVRGAPIANSQDGLGAEIEDSQSPSWMTMGAREMPAARIGFLIASPALRLAEGDRTVTVTLSLTGIPAGTTDQDLVNTLVAELSGEEGWVTPDDTHIAVSANTITLTLTLTSTTAAVTPADSEVLGEDFGTTDPLLKVTLHHPDRDDEHNYAYALLRDTQLQSCTLATHAANVTSLTVQNDQFTMDAAKPFEPFGSEPRAGSKFYVGYGEALCKQLTKMQLRITWDLLPDSLALRYEGYDVPKDTPTAQDFLAESHVLNDGVMVPIAESSLGVLFSQSGGNDPEISRTFTYTDLGHLSTSEFSKSKEWTPTAHNGFLRLSLGGHSFLHDKYVSVLTRQSIAVARFPFCSRGALYRKHVDNDYTIESCTTTSVGTDYEPILPDAPYTPTISGIQLDYWAQTDSETAADAFTFLHLEPFGYREVTFPTIAQINASIAAGEEPATKPALLPQFHDEGTLYVGIEKLQPLQSLALLFQVAEATANTDVQKPDVVWSYLVANEWVPFQDYELLDDATRGLIASGILSFTIPRGITDDNTSLPTGLHWLRATVASDADGVSETLGVHTQAVRATFQDQGNDKTHLETPLPAESVTGLAMDDAAIGSVVQPYDSFAGRPAEDGMAFYTRVAEHLRHKGRAITLFDYEHLVLEQFPGIYKAKCINHTDESGSLAPGHVQVAVIPDFAHLKAADRRAPKVTLDTLDQITEFLQSINCPFAGNTRRDGRHRLHVTNPHYELVTVSFRVRFMPDVTAPDFYIQQLNTAINRYLSPWAFEDRAEVAFGGKLYKSSILNLVEEQPYVDYVTDFVLTHPGASEDLDAIEASTPRSILIPVKTHDIQLLSDPHCSGTRPYPASGIGKMTIRHDFEVHTQPKP